MNAQRPPSTYQRPANQVQKPGQNAAETVETLMTRYSSRIADILPQHMTAKRMTGLCLTELRRTPQLQKCDALSLMGCIMQIAQLGLEPGPTLGQAYLVPYGSECTLILGYRGMITLARNSGEIVSIDVEEVYEGDHFRVTKGTNPSILHQPAYQTEDLTHVYAVAHLKGGGCQFRVMSLQQVQKHREKYASKGSKAWNESFEEMAKKTVLRKLFKYLPMSTQVAEVLEREDSDTPKNYEVIDANHTPVQQEPDVEKIMSYQEAPAADREAADLRVAIQLLEKTVDELNAKGIGFEQTKHIFGGKYVDAWTKTATLPDVFAAMEKLKTLKAP